MYRRSILIGSFALLVGCNNPPGTNKTVAQVANDVNVIAAGLQGVLTQLGPMTGINSDTLIKVSTAIAGIQSIAKSISQVSDVASAQPLVQQLETYLNTIVSVLAAVPFLPPPVTMALQAASILLPVIETLLGMFVSAKPMLSTMTPDQARLILKASASTK